MPRVRITDNFFQDEFDRKPHPERGFPQACPYPDEWVLPRLRPLCEQLEIIRFHVRDRIDPQALIHVGSGYREPQFNKATPGAAKQSQHMQGRAADIVVAGTPASHVHRLILDIINEGKLRIGGLGFYGDRFVHVDIRTRVDGILVRWNGPATRNGPE